MRYLTDQQVEACPPSAWYRFRKFASRNRGSLVTACVVMAALLTRMVVSLWQAHEARRACRLADLALGYERQARSDAEVQRRRAQAAFDRALNRMSDLYRTLHSGAMRDLPPQARRPLANEIITFFHEIVNDKGDNKVARLEKAQAYLHLGRICGCEGELDQVDGAYEQAIAILDSLSAEYPLEAVHWQELGQAHNLFASHLMSSGRTLRVQREWREAADAYRQAVKVDPSDPRGRGFLGRFLSACFPGAALVRAGRPKEAEAACREALAELESLLVAGQNVHNNLAWALATCPLPKFRDPPRAVQLAREAVGAAPGGNGLLEHAGCCQLSRRRLDGRDRGVAEVGLHGSQQAPGL
jgi:tetratricopeptide (TPR) repeat protein